MPRVERSDCSVWQCNPDVSADLFTAKMGIDALLLRYIYKVIVKKRQEAIVNQKITVNRSSSVLAIVWPRLRMCRSCHGRRTLVRLDETILLSKGKVAYNLHSSIANDGS